MASLDLACVATELAIVDGDGDDPRCVFFFLLGEGERATPISLPIRGVWNGGYPELDAGWHQATLLSGLQRLGARPAPARSRSGTETLIDIVAATFRHASPVVTAGGEPITFSAALEAFYDVLASEGAGAEAPRPAGSALEVARSAVGRDDLAALVYADAPAAELASMAVAFGAFRRWFEASRTWQGAIGQQFDHEEIIERARHAAERFTTEAPPKRAKLEAALATYESEPQYEEDEDEIEDNETDVHTPMLVEHIRATLTKRPGLDAAALAGSIEIFRMLRALPVTTLPARADTEANKARWRKAIERVGTGDVPALVRALRER